MHPTHPLCTMHLCSRRLPKHIADQQVVVPYLDIPKNNAIVKERFFKNKAKQNKTLICKPLLMWVVSETQNYKSLCQVLVCS